MLVAVMMFDDKSYIFGLHRYFVNFLGILTAKVMLKIDDLYDISNRSLNIRLVAKIRHQIKILG